ncbi:MAG: hypothetical protein KJ709_05105 [Nanoarchaeota archaeon]|nr:hypothetical protein [Nanoarchaeota archaeon]
MVNEPSIVRDEDNKYVIVGSGNHGKEIPQESVLELISSLEGTVALKMEGDDEVLSLCHPMSAAVLTKAIVGNMPFSYLPESDEVDIGQKLLLYLVPERLAEAMTPFVMYDRLGWDNERFLLQGVPLIIAEYKEKRFRFIDEAVAIKNFWKIMAHWTEHDLDLELLFDLGGEFEKYMGEVRHYEFWTQDLLEFKHKQEGMIAVCCGNFHTPFVQTVLEGNQPKKPDNWQNHVDKYNSDLREAYKVMAEIIGV